MSYTYHSNYIYKQDPSYYGNNQSYWEESVNGVVADTVNTMKKYCSNNSDLKSLFYILLDNMGSARAAIAKNVLSKNWEIFGKKRLENSCITPLTNQYSVYGKKMVCLFASIIEKMEHDLYGFSETKYAKSTIYNGIEFNLEVEVFNSADMMDNCSEHLDSQMNFTIRHALNKVPDCSSYTDSRSFGYFDNYFVLGKNSYWLVASQKAKYKRKMQVIFR